MFDRFLEAFPPVEGDLTATDPRSMWPHGDVRGFEALMTGFAGRSFHGGLYRLHTQSSGNQADEIVGQTCSSFRGQVYCFAYDWLGRQFALERDRRIDNEPLVLLIDLIEQDGYEIDATFVDFHNRDLIESADAALEHALFEEWAKVNPQSLPLRRDQMVGYRIPLSLGGRHELANLEVVDFAVAVSLEVQIQQAIRGLSSGQTIGGVRIDAPDSVADRCP